MNQFTYIGSELQVFSLAANWKAYYRSLIDQFISGEVLEVGAGIGATTEALCARRECERWVCLEPDSAQASLVAKLISGGSLPPFCRAVVGTVADLGANELFDTILYIDVLEHIGDDAGEMVEASLHLKSGGRLIVLAPAHKCLYTPFDAAVGHYRRYDKKSLSAVVPEGLICLRLSYLDAAGALASAGNKLVLRSALPTERQIRLWDSALIPLSRAIDPLLGFKVGKSVLGVWRRP